MAVAAVKNVPKVKNPYGSLGPSPATVKKITPSAYNPSASLGNWGMATQANVLPGHDAPGTAANPFAPAVTAPPATPGHWNPVDYASMIPGDWQVTDAEAQGNKAQGEAEAAFQKSLRQAFIDYGGDSSKLGDYSKYIDEPTIAAAQANKFSATAQNLAAMTKSLRQSRAALAARGIGASGQNTEITRRALEAKEQGDYTSLRSLLGYADEGTAGLAQTRQQIADKIAEARQAAAARLSEQYSPTWDPGTPASAPPVPGTVNWSGVPMNASQLAAELARTGVNRATWIRNHPGAAQTLGWS